MSSKVRSSSPVRPADIFECRRCGDCCIGYGGTFVTDAQVASIADHIGMTPEGFVAEKCRLSGGKPVFAQGEDGYCIFWDGQCTIYPVRSDMCRKWPFIESVLRDVTNWSIMAASCPGMRTDVSDEAIQACVREELSRTGREEIPTDDASSNGGDLGQSGGIH